MQSTSFVATSLVLVLALLRGVPRFAHGQPHVPATSTIPSSKTLVWERRVNASLDLLQTKSCKFFIPNGNCTQLRSLPRSAMNVYVASAEKQRGRLTAVLPGKIKLVPTSYDAVLVIDPYPQASFGHPVLVFFIEMSSRQSNCGGNRRSTYTGRFYGVVFFLSVYRCHVTRMVYRGIFLVSFSLGRFAFFFPATLSGRHQ